MTYQFLLDDPIIYIFVKLSFHCFLSVLLKPVLVIFMIFVRKIL